MNSPTKVDEDTLLSTINQLEAAITKRRLPEDVAAQYRKQLDALANKYGFRRTSDGERGR